MKKAMIGGVILALIFAVSTFLEVLGARSGVTSAQVAEVLEGDEIIEKPWTSIDRATALEASPQRAWPWLVQLGKARGGWYAPEWLEDAIHAHSASTIVAQFQNLKVGDVLPDWGGGTLTVLAISPNNYILYGSHFANADSTAPYDFTWLLVLEGSSPTKTIFHLRLRIQRPTGNFTKYIPGSLPGLIDYLADEIMFAGLIEKLRPKDPTVNQR